MKPMAYTLIFILFGLVLIRLFPVDYDAFHIDPGEPDDRLSQLRLIGPEAPRFQGTASEVLAGFEKIALGDRNVQKVRGGLDEGMITFMSRTFVFGFRDFITVKAVDEAEGAKLAIYARPRGAMFYDWGVNARRLNRWLPQLEQAFPRR